MSVLTGIGSEIRSLIRPFARGSDALSPLSQAATTDPVQNALMKSIQTTSSQKTGATDDEEDTATKPKELGKDTFLQLLVEQMRYQDPMAPTDNAQMIAQLAQFSSLEQMNNLNEKFETLSGNIDQLNFLSASSMIGKHVAGIGADGSTITGEVSGVTMKGSIVYLNVGDKQLSMAGVQSITDPA
jgi:flagellar basal-body rod modification protein FlgD